MTSLAFQVTGIWERDAAAVDFYGQISDPTDGEVVIPLNDSRTASVTFSLHDPVVGAIAALPQVPYMVCLKVYYRGLLVFWGPVKGRTPDAAAGTIRLDAVDPTYRMIRHALRRGDLAGGLGGGIELSAANGDQGFVTADHRGLRLIRDAADTLTLAPLGIADGGNDLAEDPAHFVLITRGDNNWEKLQEVRVAAGAELEFAPVDGTAGVYCEMNIYLRQGVELDGNTMALHYGFGLDNVENVALTDGEQYTNLAHVTDSDGKFTVTVADAVALARTGPYIDWVSAGFGATEAAEDADTTALLQKVGEDILRNQGRPLAAFTVTMPPDTDAGDLYLREYAVGDRIPVAAKAGLLTIPEELHRIVSVTLRQEGDDGQVRPELALVPEIAGVTYSSIEES